MKFDRRYVLVALLLCLATEAHAGDPKGAQLPPWSSPDKSTPAVVPTTAASTPPPIQSEPPPIQKVPPVIPVTPAAPEKPLQPSTTTVSAADAASAAQAAAAAAAATAAAAAAPAAAPDTSAADAAAAQAAAAQAAAASATAAAAPAALPAASTTKAPPAQLPPISQLPSQIPSQLPSQLPSQIPSQLPSQLPSIPSQFPGQVPSQLPPVSQLPSQFPGQLPPVDKLGTALPTLPTALPLPPAPVKAAASSTGPAAAHVAAPTALPAATLPAATLPPSTAIAAPVASPILDPGPVLSTHFQGFAMSEKSYELVDMQVPTPNGTATGKSGTINVGGDAFTLWNYRVSGPYTVRGQTSPFEAYRSGDMASWRGARTAPDVRVWQVTADVYPATAPAWHRGGAFYPRRAGSLWVRIIQKVDTNIYIQAPGPQTAIMDGFVSFWSARYRLLSSGAFNAPAAAPAAPTASPSEPNTEDLKKSF